jgi:biopolymer transport protein ExbB
VFVDGLNFLLKGGPVMWPLFACAIVSVAIMIERTWVLRRALSAGAGLVRETQAAIQSGRTRAVSQVLASRGGPVARILAVAVEHRDLPRADLESMIEEVAVEETPILARGVGVLDTIVTIAPLLGLLGTVTGMIKAFQVIAISSGTTTPTGITGGVAEALIATATGLFIAIVTLVGYNYLTGQIKSIVSEMEIAATKIVNSISRSEMAGDETAGAGGASASGSSSAVPAGQAEPARRARYEAAGV